MGGGINMVTNKGAKSYLDASYSIGSFNTHRLSLNTQSVNDTTGLMFKLTGFYNYSDNDYWMHSNQNMMPRSGYPMDRTASSKRA
ncbi:hypothetical protein KUH03_32210 [Sphingobacterium sp. E70]|uniref:hypothetical protein n=1 Tax=Sphingobacterium sp. E70 TaxID=2853439 RepID=UPI00211C3D89|nr:hypothetical protein [Sphingobacterium sp. E70]ULT23765.1 hypothetical protein KUH03_32210 [Sphingobacterium sp. E70]